MFGESVVMNEYLQNWNERIRRDLASFVDPGTEVGVEGSLRKFRATWTTHGQPREAMFSVSPDQGVHVRAGDGDRTRYRTFLSGPDMADLRHVAQMIHARMMRSALRPSLFISAQARCEDRSGPAIKVLNGLLGEEEDTTRVMMITGGAGSGKTCVLKELVRQRAAEYLSGRTSTLLLYVNAQGRQLARLNEALATELQDLKVGLTYHSVAVLAQLGVFVPVIDGFDELLGVSGYDDAFSSLAGFLEQPHGEGHILASARSTYYEEEFLERARRASATGDQAWSHVPIQIQDWSEADRDRYLEKWVNEKHWSSSEESRFRERVKLTFQDRNHAELARKPLFFTRVVDLLEDNSSFSGGDDLLRTLVRQYSSRELKDKLLDRHSRPVLTEDQFADLMQELAEEMWNQETRVLDVGSIRFVAEYFVHDAGLSDDVKQMIVERLPAMAFLGRGDGPVERGGITFEHELFFFYFLARTIAARINAERTGLGVILSRSALPEEVADRVALEIAAGAQARPAENRLQERLNRLSKVAEQKSRRTMQVRENAGLLAMALLRAQAGSDAIQDCIIRSVVFPGSHLKDVTMSRCQPIDVVVRRTDLTSTRLVECQAQRVFLYEPKVSRESTRLELTGLAVVDVVGLRVREEEMDICYDPSFIAETLRSCGVPLESPSAPEGPVIPAAELDLMERLMRAYNRTAVVCLQDPRVSRIVKNPRWSELEGRLIRHGIMTLENRATSGKPMKFLRPRFPPTHIMAGRLGLPDTDSRIRSFWKALENPAA